MMTCRVPGLTTPDTETHVNIALRRFPHNHCDIATEGSPKPGLCPTLNSSELQGFFIVHSTIGSTVHSMSLDILEYCICTATKTNIRPDRDSNLVHTGCKPQSIRMSHRGRPLKHKTLVYHFYNVGTTLGRRCTYAIQIPCVCNGYVLSVIYYSFCRIQQHFITIIKRFISHYLFLLTSPLSMTEILL